MIVKHGLKLVSKPDSRLSTAKVNPEILELRAFLKGKPAIGKSVAIRRKSVFILWGGGMYEKRDIYTNIGGKEEWDKTEIYHDNGLATFFLAIIAISLSITVSYLIISGTKNNNEAKNFRGGTSTIQESASNMRKNQRSGY